VRRYLAVAAVVAAILAVGLALAGLKASGDPWLRRGAFAAEAALALWPEALWRGSWLYPGQRWGMLVSHGFVHGAPAVLAVQAALVAGCGAAVAARGGGWRFLAVFAGGLVAGGVAQAGFGPPQPGLTGAGGAVHALAAAAAVWALAGARLRRAGALAAAVALGDAALWAAGAPVAPAQALGGFAAGLVLALLLAPGGRAA
jgi:membrane associated rhomboid family serine protease